MRRELKSRWRRRTVVVCGGGFMESRDEEREITSGQDADKAGNWMQPGNPGLPPEWLVQPLTICRSPNSFSIASLMSVKPFIRRH